MGRQGEEDISGMGLAPNTPNVIPAPNSQDNGGDDDGYNAQSVRQTADSCPAPVILSKHQPGQIFIIWTNHLRLRDHFHPTWTSRHQS